MSDSTNSSSSSNCFSGILRRILYSPSNPPDPIPSYGSASLSENLDYYSEVAENSELHASSRTRTPVVARLMGLDSSPDPNCTPKARNPMVRSRSANCINDFIEFDPIKTTKARAGAAHRRARTASFSFCDSSSFLFQDKRDSTVLCLGKAEDREAAKLGSLERRPNEERESPKERISHGVKAAGKRNGRTMKIKGGPNLKLVDEKEALDKLPKYKNEKKKKKTGRHYPISAQNRHLFSNGDSVLKIITATANYHELEKSRSNTTDYWVKHFWKIRKWAAKDIEDVSWVVTRETVYFQDICMEVEQHVVDHLLNQLVDELVGVPIHEIINLYRIYA